MTRRIRASLGIVAARLGALSGWRRWLIIVLLGVSSALALPPWHWVFMLIPGFCGLLIAVGAAERATAAFADGWWFGVGHFAVGFHWVAHAFFVDAAAHGMLAPVAVAALAAGLAVFPGLAALLCWTGATRLDLSTTGRILFFAVFWTALEWIRGWLFTGLPWNLMGTVWDRSDAMIQFAGFGGVYVLGLLTLSAATGFLALVDDKTDARAWRTVGAGVAILALVYVTGAWRLSTMTPEWVDGIHLRLVQPNIPQHLKWKNALRAAHVKTQMDLSRSPSRQDAAPTHLIWAETAVPFNLSHDPPLIQVLGSIVPAGGHLISGAPRAELGGEAGPRYFNSLHAIDADGTVRATYDKIHLVPFGEYVPLRGLFGFSKLTAGRVDFSAGAGPRILDIAGLPPVAPLICYEAIFPAEVTALGASPAWLLNVTNDGWFGMSAGPYQHLAAARLRSVEMGIPLVRVANTGISVVTDSLGRVIERLELGEKGVIDSGLPARLPSAPPYGRWGDRITAAVLFAVFVLALLFRRRVGC